MKKFKFRLDRVHQTREVLKEERLRELQVERAKVQAIEVRIADLTAQEVSPEDGALPIEVLRLKAQYRARVRAEKVKAHEELKKAQEAQEVAFIAFAEAAKDERALALLKIKKKTEYDADIEAELQKFIDEAATMKAGRTNQQESEERNRGE